MGNPINRIVTEPTSYRNNRFGQGLIKRLSRVDQPMSEAAAVQVALEHENMRCSEVSGFSSASYISQLRRFASGMCPDLEMFAHYLGDDARPVANLIMEGNEFGEYWLKSLAVDPETQESGWGWRAEVELIRAVADILLNVGANAFMVNVQRGQEQLMARYQELGFRREVPFENGFTTLVMDL